jgi:hypothetical protein
VDESQPWAFYWGRRKDEGPALLLRVDHVISARRRDLKGVAIEALRDGSGSILTLTLKNELDGEVFVHFCRRLIQICGRCSTEASAVSQMLLEIERWHEFLGLVRNGLSLEQRQGIFGELSFVEELLTKLDPLTAFLAWEGPEGGSQDFVFSAGCVEVKTLRVGSSRVRISSEFQLDVEVDRQMYLRVFHVEDVVDGLSIFDLVQQINAKLDPHVRPQFMDKLELAGLLNPEKYDGESWKVVSDHVFLVGSDFPALRASDLDSSISSVQYRMDVGKLSQFRCTHSEMYDMISSQHDDT